MAIFDVSFLNKKFKKSASQDYGFLIDALEIKENQLSADGKLSPGDMQILKKQAMDIYAHPGLTAAQRSNIEVKVSSYDSKASVSSLKDLQDIGRMNGENKDDLTKATMLFGNNPEVYLKAKGDLARMKLDQLSQSIDALTNAGDDASAHMNEYNAVLSDLNDTNQAYKDVQEYKKSPSGKPGSDFVAYVTTNSKGEISGVEIGRAGSKTGYLETSGIIDGLQVYGKLNRKEYGKNVFQLGNTKFTAADYLIPGPDGTMKPTVLTAEGSQETLGGSFTKGVSNYTAIDAKTVKTQSAIYDGGWAEGAKGSLYKKLPDGSYEKYVNADKEQLGISDNDLIRIPNSFEQSITPNVRKTIDGSIPFTAPLPAAGPQINTSSAPATATPTTLGAGRSRTPEPTVRSPQTASGTAQGVLGKAKSFLSNIFGI